MRAGCPDWMVSWRAGQTRRVLRPSVMCSRPSGLWLPWLREDCGPGEFGRVPRARTLFARSQVISSWRGWWSGTGRPVSEYRFALPFDGTVGADDREFVLVHQPGAVRGFAARHVQDGSGPDHCQGHAEGNFAIDLPASEGELAVAVPDGDLVAEEPRCGELTMPGRIDPDQRAACPDNLPADATLTFPGILLSIR